METKKLFDRIFSLVPNVLDSKNKLETSIHRRVIYGRKNNGYEQTKMTSNKLKKMFNI